MRTTVTAAVAGAVALSAVVLGAAPASADHVHFRVLGNGDCILLAADGGEQEVVLPHADEYAANRRHPLHVNVHLGTPGQKAMEREGSRGDIYVAYPASGVLTPEAVSLCGGDFLND